jgi:hypothetical protein
VVVGLAFLLFMRMPRLKAPPSVGSAFYHCISRVVERRFHSGPVEKVRISVKSDTRFGKYSDSRFGLNSDTFRSGATLGRNS